MNKIIMFVDIVEQFATIFTLFRFFLPNAHCTHDSSLNYWLCIYYHITNKETLPTSYEQMSDAVENFEVISLSLGTFPRNSCVLLAYDNDWCVNEYFKCAGNFDFWRKGCSQMTSPRKVVGGVYQKVILGDRLGLRGPKRSKMGWRHVWTAPNCWQFCVCLKIVKIVFSMLIETSPRSLVTHSTSPAGIQPALGHVS